METVIAVILAGFVLYWLFAPKRPGGPPQQHHPRRCRCRR